MSLTTHISKCQKCGQNESYSLLRCDFEDCDAGTLKLPPGDDPPVGWVMVRVVRPDRQNEAGGVQYFCTYQHIAAWAAAVA